MGAKILWSLFNKADKQQLDQLKLEQAQVLIRIVPPSERRQWYVWKSGTSEWKPVETYPELLPIDDFDSSDSDLPPPPEPPSDAIFSMETDEDIELSTEPKKPGRRSSTEPLTDKQIDVDLDMDLGTILPTNLLESQGAQKVHDARGATRFRKKFKLRVDVGDAKYSLETQDISLTGIRLRQPIPIWIRGRFFVVMYKGVDKIVLECSIYTSNKKPDLSRLIIEHTDQMDVLRDWLLSSGM